MSDTITGRGRVVAIMPARNSAKTLEDTFRRIPPGYVDQVILVDNASRDDPVAIAERLGITVIRHPSDRGFGGSIKRLFRAALATARRVSRLLSPGGYFRHLPPPLAGWTKHRDFPVLAARPFSALFAEHRAARRPEPRR